MRTRVFRRLRDGGPRALLRSGFDFTMDWEAPRVLKNAGLIVREFLDWNFAAALATVLLVVTLAVYALLGRLTGGQGHAAR